MTTFVNLLRAISILVIGTLIGYYDFQISGWIGIVTNAVFFVLGVLLVTTWKKEEKSKYENNSDEKFLNVQSTNVNAAEHLDEIDKVETNTPTITENKE